MKKVLIVGAALMGFTYAANAQNVPVTASATATAIIVSPLTIIKTVDMHFGNVAVDAASGGTVVLPTTGTRTATGGVSLPAVAGTPLPATFDITGEANYIYVITLPSTPLTITHTNNTDVMTVDNFISDPTPTGTLDVNGQDLLTVGATLNVAAAQLSGTYTSATMGFDVTVVYQ